MQTLLNRYLGKISFHGTLRAPPGEASNAGGAGGESQTGDSNNGNGNEGDGDGDGDGDDDDISEMFGDSGEVEDTDFDVFGQADEYKATPEETQEQEALAEQLRSALADYSIADADIPDDFDSSDPKQLRDLLTNTQRGAIGATMRLLVPVINHALTTQSRRLKHHFDSASTNRGKQGAAVAEFKSLGLTDSAHITLAKPLFTSAMRANNGDAKKAGKAVRRALTALGISTQAGGRVSGGGGNSGTQGTVRQGPDALDSIFGKQSK